MTEKASVQTPISTSELHAFLPHRPPMIWIDEVGSSSADGGTCFVTLKREGLYFSEGVLRPTSLIEFLAQGFGYVAAAHKVRCGFSNVPAVQKAFLVAVTQAHFHDLSGAKPGTRLTVTLSDVKQIGPIQLFKGTVSLDTGAILGTANLKVFSE